jgi:L-amino acid N-acyltransferase YncA
MIGVIDAENQSSVVFHEKFDFKTVGTIKILLKFDRWLHSVLCTDFRKKKRFSQMKIAFFYSKF